GLGGALAHDLGHGPRGGWVAQLVAGLAFGSVVGLIRFVASPSIAQRANSPTESQRGDKQLMIFALIMCVLVFGLVGPPLLTAKASAGLVLGLTLGLPFGLWYIRTCWSSFVLMSLWMGMRRQLPFGLMRFLDDAYRLGLLRIVGPVYQFRHATLQDHL